MCKEPTCCRVNSSFAKVRYLYMLCKWKVSKYLENVLFSAMYVQLNFLRKPVKIWTSDIEIVFQRFPDKAPIYVFLSSRMLFHHHIFLKCKTKSAAWFSTQWFKWKTEFFCHTFQKPLPAPASWQSWNRQSWNAWFSIAVNIRKWFDFCRK